MTRATTAGVALRARGVGRSHGAVRALAGVDLDLREGEALALLGPNGAGKTTLLELLAGVAPCPEGVITPPGGGRRAIGWVPQRPAVYPRLTARENLALFARLEGAPAGRVDDLLRSADLAGFADRPAAALSTGILQRLNLAVALAGDPAVLLLDEPTATISPDQRLAMWHWIEGLRERGMGLLFSTQSVREAAEHADRTLVLVGGRAVFAGTVPALVAEHGRPDDRGDLGDAAFLRLVGSAGSVNPR
ncbi:MAG: ABC transporter ATP-binding protein [Miltoncostaeaceae bacterium]